MKKWIAFALVLVIALSLSAGCGGGGGSNSGSSPGSSSTPGSGSESSNSASTPPASTPQTDSGNNANANLGKNVILASQIITLEDARRLLGEGIEINENLNDTVFVTNAIQIEYFDAENKVGLGVMFYQDAMLSEGQMKSGGAKSIGEASKEEFEKTQGVVQVEDLGDWAILNVNVPDPMIKIGYGNYYIQITSRGTPDYSNFSKPGDIAAWRTELLKDAGKLAAERLEAIVK